MFGSASKPGTRQGSGNQSFCPGLGRLGSRSGIFGALLALMAWGGPSLAQDNLPLRLELNRLEARDNGACRVWFVANNPAAEAIDPLRVDLVLFGKDGVILRRLAVDVGPLPASRTSVRIFDVSAQRCEDIGQLLLNDVLACGTAEASERSRCVDRISISSRAAGVAFSK